MLPAQTAEAGSGRRSQAVLAQFLRFALVGVAGTAGHYLVLGLLVEVFDVAVLPATTAGFAVGALINDVLNRRFTFDSQASHISALPKFLVVAALGAVINALVVAALMKHLGWYYLAVQLFATGTVLVWNFAVNALWTFRK